MKTNMAISLRRLPLLLLLLSGTTAVVETTILQPNDIQIVAYASDAPDAFVS